ncbi:hypothetical protein J1N35_016124 [Gossypium stocksii]|uniref:Uncharacterized protein n=1 Tax=Gossypium stocksii TaxID=47602 RepID=A0A9D3VYE5_9ROSI|nr:hypothetical protein J1N35_016124 [Gossypium stocksii]
MADVDRGESPSRLERVFEQITLKTITLLMVLVNQILGKRYFFISEDVSWNHVRQGSKTLNNIRMLSWDDGLSAPRSELDS